MPKANGQTTLILAFSVTFLSIEKKYKGLEGVGWGGGTIAQL